MSKLRSKKTLAAASAALVVAGGGGAAIALAQGSGPSPRAFFDSVARHLGVSSEELEDATKAAALEQVDAALEAGEITQEQADELKSRIESGKFPFFGPGLFGPRFGPEPFWGFREEVHMFVEPFSAAAAYLGLSIEELKERLGEGRSLADVAEAEGKSVDGLKEAIVADAKKELEEAVSDGRLTQKEADAILERLEARVDDLVNNTFEGRAFPGPHGFGLFGPGDHFSAAAAYLGLTVERLKERLGDGRSLADVAEAEGKSVDGLKEAIVADAKKELDEAVSDGRLTREEANAILERLESHIDEFVNATFRVWRGGGRFFDVEPRGEALLWSANA